MSPETIVQLLQFGAMGLLAFMIWTGKQIMDRHLDTLKTLIDGSQQLMLKLIDVLLAIKSEQVNSAKRDFSNERSGTSQIEKSELLT